MWNGKRMERPKPLGFNILGSNANREDPNSGEYGAQLLVLAPRMFSLLHVCY